MFALIVPLLYNSFHICSAVPQYNPIWDNLYRFSNNNLFRKRVAFNRYTILKNLFVI